MKKIIYLLIILVCLAGCLRQPPPTTPVEPARSVESAAPSPSPFPTATRTHTATPEAKPLTATAIATATHLPPTVTATRNDAVTFSQLQELPGLPESANIPGSIILAAPWEVHSYYETDFRQITIWNMETNKQHNLLSGEEHVEDITVSPDGQWLKYTKKKYSETDNWFYPASLHIASVDGREQKIIPWVVRMGSNLAMVGSGTPGHSPECCRRGCLQYLFHGQMGAESVHWDPGRIARRPRRYI
jgi:hypothetical protein